jgi:hypothetical protein
MRRHSNASGFGFQADLLTMVLETGATYIQVHAYGKDHKGARSTAIRLRNFLSVGHTLLEIAIRRIRRMLYGRGWPRPVEISAEDVDAGRRDLTGGTAGELPPGARSNEHVAP